MSLPLEYFFQQGTVQCANASMMCVTAARMVEKAKAMSARAKEIADTVAAARASMATHLRQ
jgi:hypothetical protein